MAKQDDNTAPASEALAAWDKLFNERESLNRNLDCCNDSAYHQPEGKVPAETLRELATAAILLQQTNTLLDKTNERQSRRPAVTTDQQQAACEPESNSDTDDRVYELQIHLDDIAGVASIAAEACDDSALIGTCNTIERECLAVKKGLDDFLGLKSSGSAGKEPAKASPAVLPKVIDDLMTAVDLCGTLRGYLAGTHEDACMRAETVVRQIEKSVRKAWDRVDYEDMERANPGVEDALSRLRAWETKCEAMPIGECADRLRMFLWDANEIMTAEFEEDGYSVVKTYTRKGLRYHLAQLEFLQELTEPGAREGGES